MKEKTKILVGFDGSDHSKRALIEAITLAKKFSGFIKIITIYSQGNEEKAKEHLDEAKKLLEETQVEYELTSILGSNPARALQNTSKEEKFNLIVVGSRGLGSRASILLGSVSRQIVGDSECNVLVVKNDDNQTETENEKEKNNEK